MKKGEDFTGVTIVYFCHDEEGNFLFNKRSKKAINIAWTVVGILVAVSMVMLYMPGLKF